MSPIHLGRNPRLFIGTGTEDEVSWTEIELAPREALREGASRPPVLSLLPPVTPMHHLCHLMTTLVLLLLKATGVIDWPVWVCTLPTWGPFLVSLLLLLLAVGLATISFLFDKLFHR